MKFSLENFDDEYAQIMEERKASALKDRKNVLYVALTRAVEGLIIIKKPKDSIFDEINMSPITLGALEIKNASRSVGFPTHEEKQIVISNYGIQEVTTKEEDSEKDYEAILFGTALHYTLEMLGSFDEVSLRSSMISLQNRYGQQLSTDSIREIEQRVKMLIEDKVFLQIFDGAEVSKEQSLSFKGEVKQIDLLLEYDDHCLVVDYKSSKKYALKHKSQVRYYNKAIESITKKSTKGMIVYLLDEKIVIEDVSGS